LPETIVDAIPQVLPLFSVSSRTGMRELAARSFLYRARCGSPDALAAARLLAAEIQNPALREQCGLPALV
jgi:hypothetical protein